MADTERVGEGAGAMPSGGFGDGPMPAALMRFNWGAFFIPVLWGVTYGVWPIVGLWFLAQFAPLFVGVMGGLSASDGSVSMPALIGMTVASDALLGFVRIWAGGRANQLYWQREADRLAAKPEAVPKTDGPRFSAKQRLWAAWGVVGIAIGLALTLSTNYVQLKPYGLQWAFAAEAVVFLGAEIGLGVWFAHQMATEYPDLEEAFERIVDPGDIDDDESSSGEE